MIDKSLLLEEKMQEEILRAIHTNAAIQGQTLDLSNLLISNFQMPDLSKSTWITSLNLKGNNLTGINYLRLPPYLKRLDLEDNYLICLTSDNVPVTVEELYLKNNNIVIFDGDKFKNLKILDISRNKLEKFTFPPICRDCDISQNKIVEVGQFPECLKIFQASDNSLKTITDINKGLREIDISYNFFDKLPELPDSLLILDCSENKINGIIQLPPKLKMLYAYKNNITGFKNIPNSLELMDVSSNIFKSMPIFPEESQIKVINVSDNWIESIDAYTIPETVTKLKVRDNTGITIPEQLFKRKNLKIKHDEEDTDNLDQTGKMIDKNNKKWANDITVLSDDSDDGTDGAGENYNVFGQKLGVSSTPVNFSTTELRPQRPPPLPPIETKSTHSNYEVHDIYNTNTNVVKGTTGTGCRRRKKNGWVGYNNPAWTNFYNAEWWKNRPTTYETEKIVTKKATEDNPYYIILEKTRVI